jgi:hypothetical protein
MSWWGAYELLAMAKGVGFTEEQARDVVGLAMLTSGGADHFTMVIEGAPAASRYGLFGLTPAQLDSAHTTEHFDPIEAMEAAKYLWENEGKGWQWSPAWSTDQGLALGRMITLLDSQKAWKIPLGADHLGNVLPEWVDMTLG